VKGKIHKPTIIMENKRTHILMTDSTSRQSGDTRLYWTVPEPPCAKTKTEHV
jgi:hypothetical protein